MSDTLIDGALPAVRPVDVVAFHHNRELYFAMRDLSRVTEQTVAISLPGYFVVVHLDGRNTCNQVQEAFKRELGRDIDAAEILRVVAALDEACLLNTPRFERAYATKQDAYSAAEARDNRDRWPVGAAIRAEIGKMMAGGTAAPVRGIRGLVAPHLDYARGGPCYADSYATLLAGEPADRYVILGTNHFGRSRSVVATGKDFVTPLGRVSTDTRFIEAVERRLGGSIRGHEFDHVAEHSIELQLHVLQACLTGRIETSAGTEPRPDGGCLSATRSLGLDQDGERPSGGADSGEGPDARFTVVPVLCPDPCGPTGTRPADGVGPDLGAFADALAEAIAEAEGRTIIIASADLSHVGMRFGEDEPTTPEFMRRVEESDREMLKLFAGDKPNEMTAAVRSTGNARRICSAGCLYAARRALAGVPCRLLRYHQAVEYSDERHVTCASAVLAEGLP